MEIGGLPQCYTSGEMVGYKVVTQHEIILQFGKVSLKNELLIGGP
jgi:hypothetical protein